MSLSANEIAALEILVERGGSVLTSAVPDKNEKDCVFRTVTPGHPVYKKLEKKGLCFYTEEDPMEDGFVFTNEIYITDEGRAAL